MGIFKKAKKFVSKQIKGALKHPLATAAGIAAGAALGPAGFAVTGTLGAAAAGQAASTLLSGGLKRKAPKAGDTPDPVALPESPLDEEFAGLPPVTQDAALRAQQEGQRATGGGVAGGEGTGDFLMEDEVKKRRASRRLLG